jgi:nitrogen-specific signal transduction histidine kinase
MGKQKEETMSYHAPAARSSPDEINQSAALLSEEIMLLDLLGAISGLTAILDRNRQIVYANEEFLKAMGVTSIELILGKRPGEAIDCINSGKMKYGCGTSEACSVCGVVNTILESQRTGSKSTNETRITSVEKESITYWDLKVTSSPVKIRDRQFYVCTVEDISSEKRRQNLERIFFHDILNSAGNLDGLLTILREETNPTEIDRLIDISGEASRDLIDDILLHRQLRDAENGDLIVKPEILDAFETLKSAAERISKNEVARNKSINFADHSSGQELMTDRSLLQRILINMLKNAFEATGEGGSIHAIVEVLPEHVRFLVKNDYVMPGEVRMQVFQRSFTTKGKGRGVGTYSIRLLTENYLMGRAGFRSTEEEGTVFYIDLPRSGLKFRQY